MKKYFFLLALSCLMANFAMAQCPESPCQFEVNRWSNRVRLCKYQDDGFKFKLSETAVVGRKVNFEFTGLPLNGLSIDFGDGLGFVPVTTTTKTVDSPCLVFFLKTDTTTALLWSYDQATTKLKTTAIP